jgi:uncharacterized zinc-type alcohol dehydrogenase-like protein
MSTTISAYAATSAADPLSATTITRRDVGPHDAAFDIHFAGICHTDIHIVRGEWGPAAYPVVPGHEIAGIVTQVGADVTKYKVGDASAWAASSTPVASVSRWTPPRQCYVRVSPCIHLCGTGTPDPEVALRSSVWAGWATSGSSSPRRWVPR